MQQSRMRLSPSRAHLLRMINILLAVIFGLLMPFVCWGAEATPGHSHARAHFVFMQPQVARHVGDAQEEHHGHLASIASVLPDGIEHELCKTQSTLDNADTAAPVTQSTPSVLAISLLIITLTTTQVLPRRRDNGGFTHLAAALHSFSPPFATITPPPRQV